MHHNCKITHDSNHKFSREYLTDTPGAITAILKRGIQLYVPIQMH